MSYRILTCNRDQELLESLVVEVEKGVEGLRVSVEGQDDEPSSTTEAPSTSTEAAPSSVASEAKDQ